MTLVDDIALALNQFTFIEDQTHEGLQFSIKDATDGSVVIITGATIVFRVYSPDVTTLSFSSTCSITDGSGGVCTYTPIAADMDTPGDFMGELQITFSDSTVGYIHGIIIKVVTKSPTS